MKKTIYLLLLLLLLPVKSYAKYDVIDSRCTNSLKASLRTDANDVTYRLSKDVKDDKVTYKAIFYNMTKDMYLANIDGEKYSSNVINGLLPGSKLQIIIYASNSTYCEGYKIITKIINIPYYNKYYKNELCNGYENYYLCKENSNVNLSEKEFEEKMKEYIESLENKEKEEIKPQEEVNKFNIIEFVLLYKYYIIGGILLILIVVSIIIINNKKRNRGIL